MPSAVLHDDDPLWPMHAEQLLDQVRSVRVFDEIEPHMRVWPKRRTEPE